MQIMAAPALSPPPPAGSYSVGTATGIASSSSEGGLRRSLPDEQGLVFRRATRDDASTILAIVNAAYEPADRGHSDTKFMKSLRYDTISQVEREIPDADNPDLDSFTVEAEFLLLEDVGNSDPSRPPRAVGCFRVDQINLPNGGPDGGGPDGGGLAAPGPILSYGSCAVLPSAQGRGLGRLLSEHAFDWGRRRGCGTARIVTVNWRTDLWAAAEGDEAGRHTAEIENSIAKAMAGELEHDLENVENDGAVEKDGVDLDRAVDRGNPLLFFHRLSRPIAGRAGVHGKAGFALIGMRKMKYDDRYMARPAVWMVLERSL